VRLAQHTSWYYGKDRPGEGAALGNLGLAYADVCEARREIEFLRGALDVFVAIERPDAAQVRATIARLEKEVGA